MKKIIITTFTAFILIITIVFLGTFAFYKYTSLTLISSKVGDSLLLTTSSVAEATSKKIETDHNRLSNYINSLEDEEIKEEELQKIFGSSTVTYGEVSTDGFLYNGETFHFSSILKAQYYFLKDFTVFSFSDCFVEEYDDEKKAVFKVNDYVVLVDAKMYLDSILKLSEDFASNSYYIINPDGVVLYQEDYTKSPNFFQTYIRSENSSQVSSAVIDDIKTNASGVATEIKVGGLNNYLCFSYFSSNVGSELIVTYLFDEESSHRNLGMLTYQLFYLLIMYGVLFTISLLTAVIILNKKNSDIEGSRLSHYYDKPYIIKVNKEGKILGLNKTIKNKLPLETKYKNINEFIHNEDLDLVDCINRQTTFTISFYDRNSNNNSLLMIPVKNNFSRYLVGTDVERQKTRKRDLSLHSHITNLPSLDLLYEDIENHLAYLEACKLKEREVPKSSLILIDINQFSNFNKVFGRTMGNLILQKISEKINNSLEGHDGVLYHTEIDLFAVFITNVSEYQEVNTWTESLINAFKKPFDIEQNSLLVDIKCGIFNIEIEKNKDLTASRVYEDAQITLLQVKSLSSLKYAVYNANFSNYVSQEQAIMDDLKIAVQNNEFVMFYQAQYDNQKERIVGFEALVRWDNPKYKFHSPSHFIEVAEKNNMIIQIGRFIMDRTFAAAKKLEPYNIHVSMNVSPVQLMQSGFVNEVLAVAKKYQLKPGSVAIEITETFLMENFNFIIEKLKLLQKRGFSIHLDDFGTGYSSMLYLKELPINTIKIDKEFTRHLTTDKYSKAIVSKIVQLAKNLELEVVAEGIETEEQNQIIIKSGCNVIQGYLIGRGVSFDDAMLLVEQYNVSKTKQLPKKKTKRGEK